MATHVYTVIVQSGEVCGQDLAPIAPAYSASCGHQHRTYRAAEECRDRLRNRRCRWCGAKSSSRRCVPGQNSHQWVESARWYNAVIHEHERGTMDYPADGPDA